MKASTEPGGRRSRRSSRTVAAVALIALTLVLGIVAIAAGSVPVLVAGVVQAVVLGSVASRLLADETAAVRRDWAQDRAASAHTRRRDAQRTAREQTAFAETMSARVKAHQGEVHRLARELDEAKDKLVGSESALSSAHREIRHLTEALAESQAAEIQARTELLAAREAAQVVDQVEASFGRRRA